MSAIPKVTPDKARKRSSNAAFKKKTQVKEKL